MIKGLQNASCLKAILILHLVVNIACYKQSRNILESANEPGLFTTVQLHDYRNETTTLSWVKPSTTDKKTIRMPLKLKNGDYVYDNIDIEPGDICFAISTTREKGYIAFGRSRRGTMAWGEPIVLEMDKQDQPLISYYTVEGYSPMSIIKTSAIENKFAKLIKMSSPDGRYFIFNRKMREGKYPIRMKLNQFYMYALSDTSPVVKKKHDISGSVRINLDQGKAEDVSEYVEKRKELNLNLHAALNYVAWIGLVPVAILIAHNKWLFGRSQNDSDAFYQSKKRRDLSGLWYNLHWQFNSLATLLSIAGLVLGFVEFNLTQPGVLFAHKFLSILLVPLLVLQVGFAIKRPAPSKDPEMKSYKRFYWELGHNFGGRFTVLVAVADVITGIASMKQIHQPYINWIWPLLAWAVIYILAYIVLEVFKCMSARSSSGQDQESAVLLNSFKRTFSRTNSSRNVSRSQSPYPSNNISRSISLTQPTPKYRYQDANANQTEESNQLRT